MRNRILAILALCFLISCQTDSFAFFWGKKKEPQKPAEVEKKKVPVEEKKQVQQTRPITETRQSLTAEARRALKEKKLKQLNNTEWGIELALFGGQGKKEKDTLTFMNNQISSAKLNRQGFTPTNYTLTVQEDGSIIWETMQKDEKENIVFWRGQIDEGIEQMYGVLSRRLTDNTTQDHSFISISKKAFSP